MKKSVFIIIALAAGIAFVGCGKKHKTLEEMQEPMSTEALSTLNEQTKAAGETKAPLPAAGQAESILLTPTKPQAQAPNLEPLPPPGPYRPTAIEIQTALKNAGYYTGNIDGKLGPKSKQAIEDFQKANNLKADGVVGPKTWGALSKYLHSTPDIAATEEPAKR